MFPIFLLPLPLAQRPATSPNEVSQAGHETSHAVHEYDPELLQRETTLMNGKQEDKHQVTEMTAENTLQTVPLFSPLQQSHSLYDRNMRKEKGSKPILTFVLGSD